MQMSRSRNASTRTAASGTDTNEMGEFNPGKARFPACITWTQLPLFSWLIPSIGHVGIGHSDGKIHDFAGPYFVSEDDFAFGSTLKYVKLDINENDIPAYNQGLRQADATYRTRMHNICCDNCHSHVARALNLMQYDGSTRFFFLEMFGRECNVDSLSAGTW